MCEFLDACSTYLVLAPKTVRRGADFTVSISILHARSNVLVTAELQDSSNSQLVAGSITVEPGNGCIVLSCLWYLVSLFCTLYHTQPAGLCSFLRYLIPGTFSVVFQHQSVVGSSGPHNPGFLWFQHCCPLSLELTPCQHLRLFFATYFLLSTRVVLIFDFLKIHVLTLHFFYF